MASINIDDLDLDSNELDLNDIDLPSSNNHQNEPTLESILNEKDDEDDEFLNINECNFENSDRLSINSKSSSIITTTSSSYAAKQQQQQLQNLNSNVCKQLILKQLSNQLNDAIERTNTGLATSQCVSQFYIAIGTSRGLVLIFDLNQILKFSLKTSETMDAVSALTFNNTSTRLLVGNVRGYISMYDLTQPNCGGKLLRLITDAHAIDNPVLHIKFTDDTKLAVFSDAGGSVFTLDFTRIMGIRRYNSTCLFSGSRGEVCCLEPLKFEKFYEILNEKQRLNAKSTTSSENSFSKINEMFKKCSIIAMASFTKLFIVTLKPELNVLYTCQLPGSPRYLPILNWQFAIIQQQNNDQQTYRLICPILAYARESVITFLQIEYYKRKDGPSNDANNNTDLPLKFKFVHLQTNEYNYKIYNFCWLNAKTLAILDNNERLHITDVKTNEELQLINLDQIKLVYNNSIFKSLATGGYVSKALSAAGENACYQTFSTYLNQLYILGMRSIHVFRLQIWSQRIDDYINDAQFEEAVDLALDMYHNNNIRALIGLPIDITKRKEKIIDKLIDVFYLFINHSLKQAEKIQYEVDKALNLRYLCMKCVGICISLKREDLLYEQVFELLMVNQDIEKYFYEALETPILNRQLKFIPASMLKSFIEYYIQDKSLHKNLELCILNLDATQLDLDQIIKLCRRYKLYDAYIYIYNSILSDYETPFNELLELLGPVEYLTDSVDADNVNYGNKLLVYLCSCLSGHSYNLSVEFKEQNEVLIDKIRSQMFNKLISKSNSLIASLLAKANNAMFNDYPLLRLFLKFNILDFLNIISITFNDSTFEAVIGLDKKQELVDILVYIILSKNHEFKSSQIGCFFIFLAKQLTNRLNNIKIDDEIFSKIIDYLCFCDNESNSDEREQLFIDLLYLIDIKKDEKSNFSNKYEFSLDRLINLALNAKFFNALEYLYELNGQYYEIIDCYLNQNSKKENIYLIIKNILNILYEKTPSSTQSSQSSGRRQTLFKLIGDRDQQLKLLKEKLLTPSILQQLVSINAQETVFLLWIEMNIELKEIIKAIKSIETKEIDDDYDSKSINFIIDEQQNNSDAVLYEFMRGLFDLIEIIKSKRQFMFYLSHLSNEYIELYINLMCVYDSDKVATYLRTKSSEFMYRIDECLRICRERKCWDAVAYLLEQSGQIEGAFNLYLEKLQLKIKLFLNEISLNSQLIDLKQTINSILNLIIELIQQNANTLQDPVKEKIWFLLFDEIMLIISELSSNKIASSSTQNDALQFFKHLGTHIINSMVGHINLNLIIEKLISNKIYNIKYFADIKDLICKMIEIYKYERVLLQTTSKLVSKDVHKHLSFYKKNKTKAFTSNGNYCQYCSKIFNDKTVLETLVESGNDGNLKIDSLNPAITIFHCGHLYHTFCFHQIKGDFTTCPTCNPFRHSNNKSSNESFKMDKYQSLNLTAATTSPDSSFSSAFNLSSDSTCLNESTMFTNDRITFTKEQINSLRLVRNRRIKSFVADEGDTNGFRMGINSVTVKNNYPGSELALAPGNVAKYI
jgi:hypothetical protein